ncbi:MAG: hypothetical protein HY232_04705 [Acidobacteria bacterium]|nr:hypothetical protein [Acidobacteriota bacterium]
MSLISLNDLKDHLQDCVSINGTSFTLRSRRLFVERHLDDLVFESIFNEDAALRKRIRQLIHAVGRECHIIPASMQRFYEARATSALGGMTIAAIGLPTLSYDLACAVFRAAGRLRVGGFAFSLSRDELETTGQSFDEFAAVIIAAALRERWQGPVFLLASRLQADARHFVARPAGEMSALRQLIDDALRAGFYNIDLDTSPLIDKGCSTLSEQLYRNYAQSAELTAYIRRVEPRGVTVSVGATLGAAGDRNSTEEDLNSFMAGYNKALAAGRYGAKGLCKIVVQTCKQAYGVPLPDGQIVSLSLDMNLLRRLSYRARADFGLAGAVQQVSADWPLDIYDRFVNTDTAEIHLSDVVQDIVLEGLHLHSSLHAEMDRFLKRECANQWSDGMTEAAFLHRMRGRAWKAFKQPLWELSRAPRLEISALLESRIQIIFEKLGLSNTRELVAKTLEP